MFLFSFSLQELNARQADLRNLSTEAFDPLTALARYMPALVKTIAQNAHKVKSRVDGPLGLFVGHITMVFVGDIHDDGWLLFQATFVSVDRRIHISSHVLIVNLKSS